MPNINMLFGSNGGSVQNKPGLKFIRGGEVTDGTSVVLSFAPGGMYLLFTKEWNASTGAYRGHHARFIASPEEDVFGSVIVNSGVLFSSTNAGVSFTANTDSTFTLVRSSATYAFRYALYRVDGQWGGTQQSTIEPYTGSYTVTPDTTTQSLPTANKRMTADVEVTEIPTDFGQVTQSGTDLSVS